MYRINPNEKALLACVAKESTRYAINGIGFDQRGFAAATDGRQLAIVKIEVEGAEKDCVIPAGIVKDAMTAARKMRPPGLVTVETGEKWATVKGGNYCATVQNDDMGRFPRIQDVIPKSFGPDNFGEVSPRCVKVNAELLRSALAALPADTAVVGIAIGDYRKPMALWTNGENRPAVAVVMPTNPGGNERGEFDFDKDYREVVKAVFTRTETPQAA